MEIPAFINRAILLAVLTSAAASGALITTINGSLSASDPTQLARLSRSGVPSDWSTSKAFPGALNVTTSYRYETFTINSGNTPYIQISSDDPNAAVFVSTYLGGYFPNSLAANRGLDTNYLGDGGSSGDAFGTDPTFFQVVVPLRTNFQIVVNDVGAGLARPFSLVVEGFIDTSFDDPITTTPEPAAFVLSMGGFGVLMLLRRRIWN